MTEYMLLMHDDSVADDGVARERYIQALKKSSAFEGGSEIGAGICVRKAGNPDDEAGGTVEVRELPRS